MSNDILMISERLGVWATSSLHAIVIVGTLCSIFAFLLIKLFPPILKWSIYKIFDIIWIFCLNFLGNIFYFGFSIFYKGLIAKIIFHELNAQEDKSKLLIYSFMCFIRYYFHCGISVFFSICLLIFLNLYGLDYPVLSIFFVVLEVFIIRNMILARIPIKIIKRESGIGELLNSVMIKNYCEDKDNSGRYKLKRYKILEDCPDYIFNNKFVIKEFKQQFMDFESIEEEYRNYKSKKEPESPPKS